MENLKERISKFKGGRGTFYNVLKGILRIGFTTKLAHTAGNERGYVYFQEFIPNNTFDIRVIVIKNKAFAIKRLARKNDFRASGSGNILYDKNEVPISAVKFAFEANQKIKAQCIAFDIVYENNVPLLLEISYGFSAVGYDPCPGYWDNKLNWHEGPFNPYGWMIDLVLNEIKDRHAN